MDYTVHGILQARILKWLTYPFSSRSSQPQNWTPGFPHCRQILYQLSHKGSPRILEWVTYPFSSRDSQPPESNPGLLHCRWIFYQVSYQGSLLLLCPNPPCQQIWKTQQWPQDWKRSVFIPIPKKGNPKECSIAFISHASKAQTSPTRLQQTWTVNFQMFKLVLEQAEQPEIKLQTFARSSKKQESSRKTYISALLTMPKPLTVWITINCGKFWKRSEYQTTWPASWETCMQVRKQQLELDMEQQTGSK